MSATDDGKIRFDLKQIKQWDNQIKQKISTKETKKIHRSTELNSKSQSKQDDSSNYRDRAGERRKQETKIENESSLEDIATKLDIEQTKFLGGDIEHTHLVKGLDYALLERTKVSMMMAGAVNAPRDEAPDEIDLDTVRCQSSIGRSIQAYLKDEDEHKGPKLSKKSVLLFRQLSYEISLTSTIENDLPTMITKSRLESSYDDRVMYTLPSNLMNDVLDGLHKRSNRSKKATQKQPTELKDLKMKPSIEPASKPVDAKIYDDDIYGGIINEEIGKYIADINVKSRPSKKLESAIAIPVQGHSVKYLAPLNAEDESDIFDSSLFNYEDTRKPKGKLDQRMEYEYDEYDDYLNNSDDEGATSKPKKRSRK